ncbi:MAG TPA: ABC transporter substrate-binding protein [Chloroflexota bacterium]|nr:ABC transporter substrate-binding protein [Chloroflexota bacterium]
MLKIAAALARPLLLVAGAVLLLGACRAPAASPAQSPAPADASAPATPASSESTSGSAPAVSAPAAAPAPPSGALDVVRMSDARVLAAGPIYVALDKGYFREQGIDLQLESSAGVADVVAFLATGDLDMASGAATVGLFNAFDRGADFRIIAPMGIMTLEDSPLPLLVRKDLYDSGELRTPADLRGRRVAMNTRGASPEYLLTKVLDGAGLTIDDVDPVNIPFPDMPAALSNGSIDAAIAAEPAATRAVSLGVGVKLVKEIVPGRMTTVILASGRMLHERPDTVRRFMIAYMKGTRDIQPPALGTWDAAKFYTPENIAIFEKYTGANEQVLRDQVPYTWDVDLVIQTDSIMDQQLTHMRNGTLTLAQPVPPERMIDDRFVREARDALGRERP